MTKTLIPSIVICILMLFFSCKEEKVYKIGVSQCSQDDWRNKMNEEIERELMFHTDVVAEIRSADDNNNKQIEDIKYFRDNGFDIIIVSPNEAAALTPIIKDVYEGGMPVMIFDRNIIGDTYTARIGVDDAELGRSAAHYALQMLEPQPRAIEIFGLRGSTPAEGRHKGFTSEFERGGGTVVASVAGDWNKEDAAAVSDSLLRIFDDVDLIYAHNDRMAIGASEVAKAMGRDEIKIIGIDAAPQIGIKAVADSVIDATFLYPTEGHLLIRTAIAILKGEPYEKETMLPLSSAVDRSNADILLLQNNALVEETSKMKILKTRIDNYWEKHSAQTSLFYASGVIILLLFGVAFLLLRAFWQRSRHQEALLKKNKLLQEERDKQKTLNEQLEQATQSKLIFFTNVSHDLRTPLTLIAEPVSQLASAQNLTPQQKTLIKIADKNVHILQRLINQILDFRKYENGKLHLSLVEIDLNHAVHDWMEAFYNLARSRDIKLSLNSADMPLVLALDPEKIERVFYNLLSNAFKYTPDNGRIDVSLSGDDHFVSLVVADTGQGISERELDKIFDRFYQVDRVHPKGSGIGLSLTKAFVELHGGTIAVQSALNQGSVFTVTLPVTHVADSPVAIGKTIDNTQAEIELTAIDSDVQVDADKPMVLVVDDNKDIQQLLCELLKEKYNMIFANNGKEGLAKALKYVPDLVVSDVMMPVMDGLECCRLIKNEVLTSHIPVLMLTACSMDEQRVQGYNSGADGYVSKPFNAEVLCSRCESLIANRKRIKELWSKESTKATTRSMTEVKAATPGDLDDEFYQRFLGIFNSQIGNSDLGVDTIASAMGLERSQFYRKIKALTNYAPVELIRRLRLKQARTLLLTTQKTISEIAYETGFSTPAYFAKCYRDAYGVTPSEARAKMQ